MNFSVISMKENKPIWEGEARVIHFSLDEEIRHHNSVSFILGHSDKQVTLCIAKTPAQLIMEKDHTLWLGEYSDLSEEILWKFKPKGAK